MRKRWVLILFLSFGFLFLWQSPRAQVFVGPNLGGVLGRTIELGTYAYIPNEDWISFNANVGYTVVGPMYFPRRKKDCIEHVYNQGWHVRVGARNGLTVDHHENHMFWGLDLSYARQNESGFINICDTSSQPRTHISQSYGLMIGGLSLGYTWNPMRRKTIHQKFLIDFGLRVSHPFGFGLTPIGERDYFSGAGFTWLPLRKVAFEPIIVARWELFHDKYGYNRPKTVKRFK